MALSCSSTHALLGPCSNLPLQIPTHSKPISFNLPKFHRSLRSTSRATLEGNDQTATPQLVKDPSQLTTEVVESVKVLKNAAKTRKVAAEEVLSALAVLESAKLDPSGFLETLGGNESPGRTWMLTFTSEKKLKGGRYFPITAVQRFDAAGKRIENGVYFGPIGALTFEGRLSWKKRILALVFESIRIKIGPLKPLEISLGQKMTQSLAKRILSLYGFTLMKNLQLLEANKEGLLSGAAVNA